MGLAKDETLSTWFKRTHRYGYMESAPASIEPRDTGARRVPRGEKRRDEIAAVAECLFLERGFAETTMQLIAARAGASKETLYRHFGGKEELFSEVLRKRSARIFGAQGGLPFEGAVGEVLPELGLNLLRFLVSPDSLALYRVVVAEASRAPELGRIFYSEGPARLLGQLSRYLATAARRSELRCPHPELAAKLFLGAIVAQHQIIGLVAGEAPSDAALSAHVAEAVELFLARYGR